MAKSKFGISCACLGLAVGGAVLIGIALFLIFSGGNSGLELGGSIQCDNIPEAQLKILTKASQKWQVRVELLAALMETESTFVSGDINRDWTQVRSVANALGPAQFLETTWEGQKQSVREYGSRTSHTTEMLDAGGDSYVTDSIGALDGNENVFSPWDATYGAAYKLTMAGAGGNLTPENDLGAIQNALSNYNSNKAWRQGKNIPETKNYVEKILRLYSSYKCTATTGQGNGNVVAIAQSYINKGIAYGTSGRCRSGQPGPDYLVTNRLEIDCSGYIARVYSEAYSKNFCWTTLSITETNTLKLVTSDASAAPSLAIPGDIIVWGDKKANGSFDYETANERDKDDHAGIFAGNNAIYESTRGGVKKSDGRAWNGHRGPFYGLYRIK